MKISIKSLLALVAITLLPLACGRANDVPAEASETSSLVGYPCEEFGHNVADPKYHCITMNGGITNTVLVELEGFNDNQRAILKNALNITAEQFNNFWQVSQAPLMSCVKKYATKDFDAKGGLGASFPELDRKIVWALTIPQFSFKYHASKKLPIKISAFNEPSDGKSYTMGHAQLGNDTVKVDSSSYAEANLNIGMNTVALNNTAFSASNFAATIYHEWLHRTGWDHPNGYEGSFIKELGLCMGRNNADKAFGLTDLPEMLD